MSALGCAVLVVAAATAGFWLVQWGAESGKPPATDGLVTVKSPPLPASLTTPKAATMRGPAASPPALPDQVVTHVRQAYPLLTDVDFRCDAGGCAVTATIPPPTGDEFLKQRQEMLLGGLAKVVEADGYSVLGPVQMDEIDDNLFHIRASIAQARR